ncbi:MAG: (d)CMP kinase [Chlamydiota bacterium]
MIITIDGPAGTGKTTVAKRVAECLHFSYFDTGAMYRIVTWLILQDNVDITDRVAVQKVIDDFLLKFTIEKGRYFIGAKDVTQEIRKQEVTAFVSPVSALTPVRESLWKLQRHFAQSGDAVFEGRDMGSVVFPGAEVKIFLTARPEVRAERRLLELVAKNPHLDRDQVLADIQKRDEIDSTRMLAPLCCPDGAYTIDTSSLTLDQVVEQILQYKLKVIS